jgi:hypothetical protein
MGLGFLTGLGLWAFGLTLVYSIPAVIFLVFVIWKSKAARAGVKRLAYLVLPCALMAIGFAAGALPWSIYAMQNGLGELIGELTGSAIAGVEHAGIMEIVAKHTINLILFGGTVVAGLRPPWGVEWLALPLMPFALAFWTGVGVFTIGLLRKSIFPLYSIDLSSLLVRARHQPPREVRENVPSHPENSQNCTQSNQLLSPPNRIQDGILLLLGVGLTLVLGFIITPFGADPSGRYFLPLSVILALFASFTVIKLREIFGSWVLGVVILIISFNLWGNLQAAYNFPPGLTTQFDAETRLDHRYDPALIDFLEDHGEWRGFTTYWISYPLAFLSEERLIFRPTLPYHGDFRYSPRDDRYLPYSQEVDAAEKVAFITGNQPALEKRLRAGMSGIGVTWQEKVIGDYHIFYQLSRRVNPEELGLGVQTQ